MLYCSKDEVLVTNYIELNNFANKKVCVVLLCHIRTYEDPKRSTKLLGETHASILYNINLYKANFTQVLYGCKTKSDCGSNDLVRMRLKLIK